MWFDRQKWPIKEETKNTLGDLTGTTLTNGSPYGLQSFPEQTYAGASVTTPTDQLKHEMAVYDTMSPITHHTQSQSTAVYSPPLGEFFNYELNHYF